MSKRVVIFTFAVCLMLVCGCIQPEPAQPAATPAPTTLPPITQVAAASPQPVLTTGVVSPTSPNLVSDNTIGINKKGFDPVTITVKSGSTVRWVNEDSTADAALYNPTHRIALEGVKNSPLLSPGQSWSMIFDQAGSYDYSDIIHQSLKGTVIVV
jgi:plastocyanin